MKKFTKRWAGEIRAWINDALTITPRDQRADLLATSFCSKLCSDLIEGDVEAFHFYALNQFELTRDICRSLGISLQTSLEKVASVLAPDWV